MRKIFIILIFFACKKAPQIISSDFKKFCEPESLKVLSHIYTPEWSKNVFVSGNCAYVSGTNSGVLIYDISDPQNPSLLSIYDTVLCVLDVFVGDSFLFATDCDSGIFVLNVKNPSNPRFITRFSGVNALGLFVKGDFVYVASGGDGLYVFQFTGDSLILRGHCDTRGLSWDVYVYSCYAFIADDDYISVCDVSLPESPALLCDYKAKDYVYDVFYDGKYLYCAMSSAGIGVFSFCSDELKEVTFYDTEGSCRSLSFCACYLGIADYTGGFKLFDTRFLPDTLILISSFLERDPVWGVYLKCDYIYLTSSTTGFWILSKN